MGRLSSSPYQIEGDEPICSISASVTQPKEVNGHTMYATMYAAKKIKLPLLYSVSGALETFAASEARGSSGVITLANQQHATCIALINPFFHIAIKFDTGMTFHDFF